MSRRSPYPMAAIACLLAPVSAQQVVLRAPVGAIALPAGNGGQEEGRPVEMFESPNLDRFLRRAREFLQQEKYLEGIQVLQSVIEGRTLEAVEPQVDPPAGGDKPALPDGQPAQVDERGRLADPAQTVFSQDGRIYRPARRLCHEYLAGMPTIGIDLYRTLYGVRAQEQFEAALASGNASAMEMVANRYFVTDAAGRALQVLADRHMHDGRYRAAVQVLRDLVELYPAASLRSLGINPLWCRFKIALCLRFAGEIGAARDAAQQIATDYPDESLRLMGDLQPVSGLAGSPLFAAGDETVVVDVGSHADRSLTWIAATTTQLVPLWQYRFAGPNPYEAATPKGGNERFVFVGEGMVSNAAPPASKYGVGTQVAFVGSGFPAPQAMFLENYRLRLADAFTGLMLGEGDGVVEPPKALENRARSRVPAYDQALLRPVEDGQRIYAVLGYARATQSVEPLKNNELVAYDRSSGARLWSTTAFLEGDDGFRDVTFLAAPTVFGERLLAPVLRRDAYSLQCLDRSTGKPLWCTRVHAGGSPFFRAPGTPVRVIGNLAYVLTNAGALAAVDAFAGDLRWIRRYERSHPLRDQPLTRKNNNRTQAQFFNGSQFVELDLPSFLPSDLFAGAGMVVIAPCDGDVLMALDGASGEPVWMLDGACRYAPFGRMQYVVGGDDQRLYVATESDLVAIDWRTGVRLWNLPLPVGTSATPRWRGRGCVVGSQVVMPGDRELLIADGERGQSWQRVDLPAFGVGDEPLRGACNLFSSGPWLACCYGLGIEVYSASDALRNLATAASTPLSRARYLVQAGDRNAAIEVLVDWLGGAAGEPARAEGASMLVSLAREKALLEGRAGLPVLDRVLPFAVDRDVRLRWHLARLDLCRQIQDMRQYEQEQQRLYRYMEGKE